ncbi:MAG: type II toxin-antitoxin system VapC family toxin [Gammaproteobacteria bacterium]|nr:type II toxin-antitoxin system VapC family toxin [Gammaproteobacteria bacterium]
MIFDTDVIIWMLRGHKKAADTIEKETERFIAIQTQLELFKGVTSKSELRLIKDIIRDLNFTVLPLTENIGYRTMIYMEEFYLSNGIDIGDAYIAATAMEYNKPLITSNIKHYKMIPNLQLVTFKP